MIEFYYEKKNFFWLCFWFDILYLKDFICINDKLLNKLIVCYGFVD